jgi:cell fate (sporulation/competence/biofilm development) regulator YlbF (YheA/YmcA/DUF963 family)
MNTTLTPEILSATTALCDAIANAQPVVAAKARIGLFFQNPEASKLFEEVNSYGEELRNKHLAGMPPTEEEIAHFDELREAVVKNDLARGFLEARGTIESICQLISRHVGLAIDLGRAPTEEEVADSIKRDQEMSASCSCGGDCHDCNGDCDCGDDCHCEH